MAKPEHYRVKAILDWLKLVEHVHPIFVFRTHQTGKTKKGIPDIHIVFYGFALWIEAKKDQVAKPTEIQAKRMEQIKAAFGYSICTSEVADVRALMQRVLHDHAGRLICPDCRRYIPASAIMRAIAPPMNTTLAPCCPECSAILRRIPSPDDAKFPPLPRRRVIR